MDAASKTKFRERDVTLARRTADEVVKRLATGIEKGLDAAEASIRLQKYGPNRLPEGKKRGPFMRFLSQFNNILVYVLLGAGFTKLMLNLWLDAAIIFGVVILNALLGFIQEGKAEKALEFDPQHAVRRGADRTRRRDAYNRSRPTRPGRHCAAESGDKVPADLRLADVKNFRTEEAALTGESVPADKSTGQLPPTRPSGIAKTWRFSGTMVVSGRATGVVVATGQRDGARPHQSTARRGQRA